jgi:LPXTG-motif cell wall-anchored protein
LSQVFSLNPVHINIKGTDEFSKLGSILNNVQTTFKGMIERLSIVSTHLNEESTQLDEGEEESTDTPDEGGDRLPDTATNLYLLMLVGIMMLLMGGTTLIFKDRRVRH